MRKPYLVFSLTTAACLACTLMWAQVKPSLSFCGWQMDNREKIIRELDEQFRFLSIHPGDTIVDVGAQSGSYEGCLLAAFPLPGVVFVLVDVDTQCLNRTRVNNMLQHYSKVKGDTISNAVSLVQNTQDSLCLPLNTYSTIWIFNTLHEIHDQTKMVKNIFATLRSRGEVVVLEIPPRRKGEPHSGCNAPLLDFDAICQLFTSNGFLLSEKKLIERKKRAPLLMVRFKKP